MRCNHAVNSALALGCFLWLATGPALSQTEQERVPMIMSKLPPQSSTTYKAIWKHAGKATSQVLTLTKTEMWSVPQGNVEAVRKAAGRYGVGVEPARRGLESRFPLGASGHEHE